MPPYHYELALRAPGPYSLLRDLPLPAERHGRMAYAARQLAAHVANCDITQAAFHTELAVDTGTCSVCYEPFGQATPAASLMGCEHLPVVCRTCLLTHVQKSDGAPRCVEPGCKTLVLPEDIVRMGGSAADVQKLAWETVRRHLQHSAVWWACPTRGCVGGTLLGIDVGAHHRCRVCDQTALVRPPGVDWRRDLDKILRLIDGLQMRAESSGACIRECPRCGVPTEHNGGCDHMRCRQCEADWDFSRGLSSAQATRGTGDEQTYVPTAGLLVAAGLYEGVAPGRGIYEAVLNNARRLRLLSETMQLARPPPGLLLG